MLATLEEGTSIEKITQSLENHVNSIQAIQNTNSVVRNDKKRNGAYSAYNLGPCIL